MCHLQNGLVPEWDGGFFVCGLWYWLLVSHLDGSLGLDGSHPKRGLLYNMHKVHGRLFLRQLFVRNPLSVSHWQSHHISAVCRHIHAHPVGVHNGEQLLPDGLGLPHCHCGNYSSLRRLGSPYNAGLCELQRRVLLGHCWSLYV